MQSTELFRYFLVFFTCIASNQWTIVNCQLNSAGLFESTHFWSINDKPVLANGHIGFIPYGDSIYMNGFYNGYKDNSHRARIPNYGVVKFEPCTQMNSAIEFKCIYALDIYNGLFQTSVNLNDGQFNVEHIQYAHRYYDTAIVNHIKIKRQNNGNGRVPQIFWQEMFFCFF